MSEGVPATGGVTGQERSAFLDNAEAVLIVVAVFTHLLALPFKKEGT